MKGNEIVSALSLSGYALSTGSACHANREEPSRIILSRGLREDEATGTIRISMGYGTTQESVDGLIHSLMEYVGL